MSNLHNYLFDLFKQLLKLMSGHDFELRRNAVMALSKLRGQVAAEIVFNRFQSENLEDYLVYAMKTMDPEKTGHILVQALNDPHFEVRLQAAQALIDHPCEEMVFALSQAVEAYLNRNKLSENSESVLVTEEALLGATRALGEIGTPLCLGLLRKLVLQESNPRIRATAVAALCRNPNDSLLPILQGLLKDPDARVRANAIEGIQRLDKPSTIGILQPYLYDSHQRVRANAAKAIWKYGDYEVSSTIREMLSHPDKKQVVSAIYAIGETKIKAFIKNLIGYLSNSDPDIRRNALIALQKFGKLENIQEFHAKLDDPVPTIRVLAAKALVESTPEQASTILYSRLAQEPEPQVRAELINLLSKIAGQSNQIDLIVRHLNDSDERVVLAALDFFAKIIPKDPPAIVVYAVDDLKKSTELSIRRKAIGLLWHWGFTEVLSTLIEYMKDPAPEIQICSLKTAGDIFANVSKSGSEMLAVFDQCLQKAIEDFRKAMQQATSEAVERKLDELLLNAQKAFKERQFQQALSLFDEALSIAPTNLAALVGRGEVCMAMGDLENAKSALVMALSIDSNSVKAQFCLGQVLHQQGDWPGAVEHLQTAIKLYPKLPQAYMMLADALENLKRYDDAYQVLRTLSGMLASNPVLQQRYARLCFLTGKVAESLRLLNPLVGKCSLDIGSQIILAVGEAMNGQTLRMGRTFLQLSISILEGKLGNPPTYLLRLLQIANEVLAKLSNPAGRN